jgi:peptidyl-prolyl cis-trans isomerase SurA
MIGPVVSLTVMALAQAAPEELGPDAVLVDRIAAVVNDDIITLSEVRSAADPLAESGWDRARIRRLYEDVLENLIAQALLDQQLEESNVEVGDTELNRAIQRIMEQNRLTPEQLEAAVQNEGLTMDEYREQVREDLRRQQLFQLNVNQRIQVSERDIREEYERITRDDEERQVVQLRHLLFRIDESRSRADAVALAEQARARVAGGEDFAAVAREVSEGPTADAGGKLGELAVSGLLPSLARVVERLPDRTLSKPVVTPNGVHVLWVDERRTEKERSFTELAPRIRQQLMQKAQQEQVQIWLDELKTKASIDRRI